MRTVNVIVTVDDVVEQDFPCNTTKGAVNKFLELIKEHFGNVNIPSLNKAIQAKFFERQNDFDSVVHIGMYGL